MKYLKIEHCWKISGFKKEKNGVYKTRLVALGYHQIPGINHGGNFVPVINKTTLRIILILTILEAEIVDIETAFIMGIWMKNFL